jgi:hypothetical protein
MKSRTVAAVMVVRPLDTPSRELKRLWRVIIPPKRPLQPIAYGSIEAGFAIECKVTLRT